MEAAAREFSKIAWKIVEKQDLRGQSRIKINLANLDATSEVHLRQVEGDEGIRLKGHGIDDPTADKRNRKSGWESRRGQSAIPLLEKVTTRRN